MAYLPDLFETLPKRSELRVSITEQTRRSEEECVKALLAQAELNQEQETIASEVAFKLARSLRNQRPLALLSS
ncbi:hypothetical protein [Aristophania vespae]|uniref:hypothetical protein n=1 Tax=Aristophania vespae TaxID=2697033 RepID=UPI0023517EA8|nr:hypothetical protein [Aristophania vespae]UMM64226.1 hypothetical protein DM15PD_12270 [Aristophania vespae]